MSEHIAGDGAGCAVAAQPPEPPSNAYYSTEFASERSARISAERSADYLSRLLAVATALSRAATPLDIANVIVNESRRALRAAACSVCLATPEGGEIDLVTSVGYAEPTISTWRRFALDDETLIGECVGAGRPIWISSLHELVERYPNLRSAITTGQAFASVPLTIDRRTAGAITVSFDEPEIFTDEDRSFVETLAQIAGQALERGKLFEAEQEARRQAEQDQSRMAAIRDSISDGFITLDDDLTVTSSNAQGAEMLGVPRSGLVGRSLVEAAPALAGSAIEEGLICARTERRFVQVQAHIASVDRWVDGRAYPGREGLTLYMVDNTRNVRTELALRETQDRLRGIFEQAAVAIVLLDLQGRIVLANRAAIHATGLNEKELREFTFRDFVHPDDVTMTDEEVERLVDGATSFVSAERRFIRKGGRWLWGRATMSVVRNDDGEPLYMLALVEDITERKRLESQLQHARRLESVGKLAGGVAHEFNNLLTAIIGHVELACEEVEQGSEIAENLDRIRSASDRAAALTRQLLAFGRRQMISARKVDVNELTDGLRASITDTLGPEMKLEIRQAPEPLWIRIDPVQFEQVMINLALNAHDATGGRGGLLIRIERSDRRLTPSSADEPAQTGCASITVSDDGPGIPPEFAEHLFEPFFTTKEFGKSRGLGLATCHGIVHQSNGHIEFDPSSEIGATFKIYLPLVEAT